MNHLLSAGDLYTPVAVGSLSSGPKPARSSVVEQRPVLVHEIPAADFPPVDHRIAVLVLAPPQVVRVAHSLGAAGLRFARLNDACPRHLIGLCHSRRASTAARAHAIVNAVPASDFGT